MNIALSTVVLFILLIPGLLFRRFYYTEEFSKEYFKQTFFGTFLSAFIPSLIFHSFWYYLAKFFGHPIDLSVIGNLLTGSNNKEIYNAIDSSIGRIILYNGSIAVTAGLAGFFFKKIIRSKKLDRTYKLFRFQNSWHYVLKGEFFDFPRASFDLIDTEVEEIEFVYIDALVDTNAGTILYEGIFVDYELSAEGGLNYITLKNTSRKFLSEVVEKPLPDKQSEIEEDKHSINGHIVVLPFHQIKNINLSYYRIEESNGSLDVKLVE